MATGNFPWFDLFPRFAACSTHNSQPVSDCNDWVTGPASSENSQLRMFYGDRNKKPWSEGVLIETDIGKPVMSPDGKQLELMVYGDTYVANPNFTLENHRNAVAKCMYTPVSTLCGNSGACLKLFYDIKPKANACTYWYAPWRSLPAFLDPPNPARDNVTIFESEIDPSLLYRVGFRGHLYNKVVRHGAQEGVDAFGNAWFTGVYGLDYFYTCPGTATTCEDANKLLYLLTQTVFWEPTSGKPSNDQILHTRLGREGIGFYRFGKLDATKSTTEGCRLRYGPDYAKLSGTLDASCSGSSGKWLQPLHPHNSNIKTLLQPENVHVYWAAGTRFSFVITAHGYVDLFHSGSPPSTDYVYFIGSGETDSNNKRTGKVYLARLPASEQALFNADFDYFKGKDKSGKSLWGSYKEAKSILDIPVYWPEWTTPLVTSFTKRFGNYYLAATCYHKAWPFSPTYGTCISSSKDGIEWKNHDFALYTDIVQPGLSAVKFPTGVYGHMWVPEALYPDTNGIAYLFSVWKSPQGYFRDYYRPGGPQASIKAEHLFYNYNTKMFLYRPKEK